MLVQLRDDVDPDTGQRFTVKRYRSERTTDKGGWRHIRELAVDAEDSVTVVAELVEVIGSQAPV